MAFKPCYKTHAPLISTQVSYIEITTRNIIIMFLKEKFSFTGYEGNITRFQCFKTVILGEVESGKTSLRKTLKSRRSHLTEKSERTVGVEQDVIFLDEHLRSCFLDFGGHESYTFLHQACMTNQTVICIAVDTPKYESKDFPKHVGEWYLKAVSRVFQPYIFIVGTKAEECSKDKLDEKRSDIMEKIRIEQSKQRLTIVERIKELVKTRSDLLNLLPLSKEQKDNMIENEEEFMKHMNQYANADPKNTSQIDNIFAKSPGLNLSNIFSEINFTKLCLDKQPIVHQDMLYVSSKSLKGIEDLRNTISRVVRDNERLFPAFDIPVAWRDVIQAIPPSEPLWSNDQFKELCKSKGITDQVQIDTLLGYLKAAGIVFQYDDHRPFSELKNAIFLDPNWIFRIIGTFFNHFYLSGEKEMPGLEEILKDLNYRKTVIPNVYKELRRSGIMNEKVIKHILRKCGVTEDKMDYVLSLLVYLDICCLHVASDEPDLQERKYRFPFLLPATPPPESEKEWPEPCPVEYIEYHLQVDLVSSVDPPGLFDKWSIRTNDHFVNRYDWKMGFIAVLKDGCSKVRILNHGSDSKGDVHYSVCARVKPEKAATMRRVLQTIQIQLRYLHLQYPYVVMEWWVVCPVCKVPDQFPLDKVIKIQPEDAATMTCAKCPRSIRKLFPIDSVESISKLYDINNRPVGSVSVLFVVD